MFTHATKTLMGTVIFLLIVTLWITFLNSGSRSTQGLPESFFDLLAEDISRIKIVNVSDSSHIEIISSGGSWKVSSKNNRLYSDQQFPANRIVVESFIKALSNSKFESIVTRKTDKFARYNVTDDLGTTINIFSSSGNNDKPYMSFIVGSSFNRRGDKGVYIRPLSNNASTVYGMLPLNEKEFTKTLLQWRDKLIWRINKNDITQIDFTFSPSDSSFSMSRAGGK